MFKKIIFKTGRKKFGSKNRRPIRRLDRLQQHPHHRLHPPGVRKLRTFRGESRWKIRTSKDRSFSRKLLAPWVDSGWQTQECLLYETSCQEGGREGSVIDTL